MDSGAYDLGFFLDQIMKFKYIPEYNQQTIPLPLMRGAEILSQNILEACRLAKSQDKLHQVRHALESNIAAYYSQHGGEDMVHEQIANHRGLETLTKRLGAVRMMLVAAEQTLANLEKSFDSYAALPKSD